MSMKNHGRQKLSAAPSNDPTANSSKSEIQRNLRNAGSNRVTGKADHLHRGDQRDRQPQK